MVEMAKLRIPAVEFEPAPFAIGSTKTRSQADSESPNSDVNQGIFSIF